MDPTSSSAIPTAVVLTGGGSVRPQVVAHLPAGALVVAADGGARLAEALGLAVHVAVGDFDSLDADSLAALAATGTVVERHPTDKDTTDLELALDRAVAARVGRVVVVGGDGGRLDHLLGVALVLGSPSYRHVAVEAHLGPARLDVVRGGGLLSIDGHPGETVSLLPVHGPVRGVRTDGLRWSLEDEDLAPGSTRGVSNVLIGVAATVAVALGTLLVVRPEADVANPEPEALPELATRLPEPRS